MLKKLFSHSIIYGLAPQIPKLASIIALPIITPFLTPDDLGVFGFITSIVGAISVFSTLGLNVVLGNMFIKSPNQYKWGWRQVYGFLSLWQIPYALLLSLIIYLSIPKEATHNTLFIILLNVIPVVFFGATSLLGMTFYRYKQKPMQIALRTVIIGFVTVALNILFIAHYKMGYMGWFLTIAIGQVLLQLSYWYPLNIVHKITPIFNFKWKFIKSKLAVGIPTVPHYYASYLLESSDRLVMKFTGVTTSNIGLYQSANTLSSPFQALGTATGQAIGPMLQQSYKAKDESMTRKLIFTLEIFVLAISFVIAIWVKELFHLLIRNPDLHAAYPLAVILIMSYTYRPMYFGANNRLFYFEKTKVLLKITFIAGVSNLLLNIIFIPIFGFEVAAYTTFISMMYMGYSGYYLIEFKESNHVDFHPLKWLSLTIILTIAAYFLVELESIYKIIIGLLVIAAAFISIRKVNKDNG